MLLKVRAQYTYNDKKKIYTGNINTTNSIFTSNDGIKKTKFDNTYEKYIYNGRIVFTNNKHEWIFSVLPSNEVLKSLGVKDIDEDEPESDDNKEGESESENEETSDDSDSDYVYNEDDEEYEEEIEEYLP